MNESPFQGPYTPIGANPQSIFGGLTPGATTPGVAENNLTTPVLQTPQVSFPNYTYTGIFTEQNRRQINQTATHDQRRVRENMTGLLETPTGEHWTPFDGMPGARTPQVPGFGQTLDTPTPLGGRVVNQSTPLEPISFTPLPTPTQTPMQTPVQRNTDNIGQDINIFERKKSQSLKRDVPAPIQLNSISKTPTATAAAPKNRLKTKYATTPTHMSNQPINKTQTIHNQTQQNQKPKKKGERAWKIIFPKGEDSKKFKIKITSKTRCESPTEEVDEKLYSSLKYQIDTTVTCPNNLLSADCLIGKCTVVDTDDGDRELLKDGKVILNGQHDAAFSRVAKGYNGHHKVQFTDCGYHHNGHHFAWRISFCVPKDLKNPILIVQSAPFIVLARRPKRSTKPKPPKKQSGNSFDVFTKKLSDLLLVAKKLSTAQRKEALKLVTDRFSDFQPHEMNSLLSPATLSGLGYDRTNLVRLEATPPPTKKRRHY